MIVNDIGVEQVGKEAFKLIGSIRQNNIPVLEDNYVRKMNANNGFSKERMFRKIASIPDVAHLNAFQDGYNLDDEKDLHRFLQDNPDYMSVERLRTGRSPNIIMK